MPASATDPRVEYAQAHQDLTQTAIAEHFGLTRSRIGQIFEAANYTHPRISQKLPRVSKECAQPECHETFQALPSERLVNCAAHRGKPSRRVARVEITCDACGKVTKRRATLIREGQTLTFCDNVCQGRWMGKRNKR